MLESKTFLWPIPDRFSPSGSIVLAVLILLGGCTEIPKAEFGAYQESFTAARTISEEIMTDYLVKRSKGEKFRQQAKVPSAADNPNAIVFDPNAVDQAVGPDTHIQQRVQAWDTIGRYNDTLAALAEGKSTQEIKSKLNTLTNSVTTLAKGIGAGLPGLGLASEIVGKFLEFAEKARLRAEFVKAVQKGKPIISAIVSKVFIPDTKTFDSERKVLADDALIKAERSVIKHSRAMVQLTAEHKNPAAGSALGKAKALTRAKLMEVVSEFGLSGTRVRIPTAAGAKAVKVADFGNTKVANTASYTQLVQTQLDQLLKSVLAEHKKRADVLTYRQDYHQLLAKYVKLLKKMDASLTSVQQAIDRPQNLTTEAQSIFSFVLDIRTSFKKLSSD